MKPTPFTSLGLSDSLLKAIKEMSFLYMTPIQAAAIPALLAGKDIIAQSKTGSGKTAAFVLPILQKLKIHDTDPQVLILCPTRELSDQVLKECQKFSKYLPKLRTVALVGGQPYPPQESALMKGVHIIVGTPGRTLELMKHDMVNTRKLRTLILDEADRLLEEGFAEEMKAIISFLHQDRQTIFFSATYPESMEQLSQQYQKNAERLTITDTAKSKPQIQQYVYAAEKPEKVAAFLEILKRHPSKCTLVFCRTKAMVDELGRVLKELKINSQILHADLKQTERDRVTALFRKGGVQVLVATDVAARGLDIETLELVINVDLPPSSDIYIHRIGRTGRAGRKGTAVSIATAYEVDILAGIEQATGVNMIRASLTSDSSVSDEGQKS